MPPETPGIGITWTTLPAFFFAVLRQALRFFAALRRCALAFFVLALPFGFGLQTRSGAASTICMSLRPRPASSAHRKRPLRVSAPPPGWLPTGVSFPTGESRRPLGWILVSGPIRPGSVVPPTCASAVVVIAAASSAARGRRRRFTARILSPAGGGREGPCRVQGRWLAEDEPARPLRLRRQLQIRQPLESARN